MFAENSDRLHNALSSAAMGIARAELNIIFPTAGMCQMRALRRPTPHDLGDMTSGVFCMA